MDSLRVLLETDKIDVFCTPTANRRKKLLCADMESTIIKNEMLEELGEILGLKDKIADITARSMNGEINFEQSLEERVALLAGLSHSAIEESIGSLAINEGAKTLVQTMSKNESVCVLITGGFTLYSEVIADQLGFGYHHANELEIKDNALTGKLATEILGPDAKQKYLNIYCSKLHITPQDALCVGDGANDLPMLKAAGLGVGYQPKPVLQDILPNQIRHTDFTAALYAQGYRLEEFVTD